MNKLLTTIILLCFSVAANADIYFCEVRVISTIGSDGSGSILDEPSGENWIVDTEKGFRSSGQSEYGGSCVPKESAFGDLVRCTADTDISELVFTIHAGIPFAEHGFSMVLISAEGTVQASSGVCTKA